jgi:hypothetical protein
MPAAQAAHRRLDPQQSKIGLIGLKVELEHDLVRVTVGLEHELSRAAVAAIEAKEGERWLGHFWLDGCQRVAQRIRHLSESPISARLRVLGRRCRTFIRLVLRRAALAFDRHRHRC